MGARDMHLESRTYMAQAVRNHAKAEPAGTVLDVGAGGPGGGRLDAWRRDGWGLRGGAR